MSDTDIKTLLYEDKKNVAFETVKGVLAGFSATAMTTTAMIYLFSLLFKKNPLEYLAKTGTTKYERRLNQFHTVFGASCCLSLTAAIAPIYLFYGFVSSKAAEQHNKRIDKFVDYLEQEKRKAPEISASR